MKVDKITEESGGGLSPDSEKKIARMSAEDRQAFSQLQAKVARTEKTSYVFRSDDGSRSYLARPHPAEPGTFVFVERDGHEMDGIPDQDILFGEAVRHLLEKENAEKIYAYGHFLSRRANRNPVAMMHKLIRAPSRGARLPKEKAIGKLVLGPLMLVLGIGALVALIRVGLSPLHQAGAVLVGLIGAWQSFVGYRRYKDLRRREREFNSRWLEDLVASPS